ncbi:LysR family transcriptional regulator [Azohydromonas australica]|uniref:LysR family transcriptional regulator n=1 Tax=Azohydromonas australica TaxID=364039 RepID=UPI001EE3D6B0|nr:LysR family transcriptional regulator [Azohydromonas australica]
MKLVEAFALIVRMGSLTKAEAHSGTSKATLSRHLQQLEAQLGVQLLVRTSRKVVPTEAGLAFHAHCDALLSAVNARLQAASKEVLEMNSGSRGQLCVLADNQFTTTFVSHVMRVFLDRYPNVECELHVGGREDSPDVEEVDCYVCAEAPDRPNLVGKLVGRLSYGLYASPQYICKEGTPNVPKDLADHASIKLRDTQLASHILYSDRSSHPYSTRSSIHTNDYWVMKTLCLDGMGIAMLPDFFVRPEVRVGSLVPVLPQWKPDRRRVFCAYQRQKFMSTKIRAFIDLVAKSIEDIDTFNNYVSSSSIQRP